MSFNVFDPYHKWLGIPPHEQPPHYYRLLGISVFENDPDVIDRAADGRLAVLRTTQNGPNAQWSPLLLSEVAAARICLLNPESKRQYDAALMLAVRPIAAPIPPPPMPIGPPPAISAPSEAVGISAGGQRRKRQTVRRSDDGLLLIVKWIGGGIAGLALGYVIAYHWLGFDPLGLRREKNVARAPSPGPAPQPRPKPPPDRRPPKLPPDPRPDPEPKAPPEEPPPMDPPKVIPPPQQPGEPPPLIVLIDYGKVVPGHALRMLYKDLANNLSKILKLETVAKKESAHEDMIKNFNKQLEYKKSQFHFQFPIVQVDKIVNGKTTLTLGLPGEVNGIVGVKCLQKLPITDWRPQKLLTIRPGDILDVSGIPMLYTVEKKYEKAIIPVSLSVPAAKTDYYLYLDRYDKELRKKPQRMN